MLPFSTFCEVCIAFIVFISLRMFQCDNAHCQYKTGSILGLHKTLCRHGRGMEINHTGVSEELATSTTERTVSVGEVNAGCVPWGRLPHQIYIFEDHGSDDDVMKARKHTGHDIKLVHEMLEVLSYVDSVQRDNTCLVHCFQLEFRTAWRWSDESSHTKCLVLQAT